VNFPVALTPDPQISPHSPLQGLLNAIFFCTRGLVQRQWARVGPCAGSSRYSRMENDLVAHTSAVHL
jgi:hypothetical protein